MHGEAKQLQLTCSPAQVLLVTVLWALGLEALLLLERELALLGERERGKCELLRWAAPAAAWDERPRVSACLRHGVRNGLLAVVRPA